MKTRSVFVVGVATGVAIGTFLAGLLTGPSATAQIPALTQPQQPRQPQILLDERRQELVYANGFRMYTAGEEVIADLGMNMPNPNRQSAQAADMLFDVRMRLVMTFATAKRYRDSLNRIIEDYEKANGPIGGSATQPAAAGAPSAAPGLMPPPPGPLTVPGAGR